MYRIFFLVLVGVVLGLAFPNKTTQAHISVPRSLQPGGDYLTYQPKLDGAAPFLEVKLEVDKHRRGRDLYYQNWAIATLDGVMSIGPAYDANGCSECHVETSRDPSVNVPLVFRSLDGAQINKRHSDPDIELPDIVVDWTEKDVEFSDGEIASLVRPTAYLRNGGKNERLAMRMPPLLFGWGLLENADVESLEFLNDPDDKNGDGVSGRMVVSDSGRMAVMGWQNSHTTLQTQVAAALMSDLGVTSEQACGSSCVEEISPKDLDALISYVRSLPVPGRRPLTSRRGQDLFGLTGCSDCHTSVVLTRSLGAKPFSDQLSWPFSDLMLHDMGPELADSPESREWRTAPLWGIGYVEKAFPYRGFLHDGRARSIEEAILWHGGEAEPSQERYRALTATDRVNLLEFVRSL
ncbi:MAG: di-heme oxidoredictase family protein [Pseudomonadota bacterium]